MKKIEKIMTKIKQDKKLIKKLKSEYNKNKYLKENYTLEKFIEFNLIDRVEEYIKLLKNNRVIYIQKGSKLLILGSTKHTFINFNYMFFLLEKSYKDAAFNFNYNLIYKFYSLEFLNKKQRDTLSQKINYSY